MSLNETNRESSAALALNALGWILADDKRAERLLALTGLAPAELRARLGDPGLLAAILRFLEGHEPDLLGCAESLGVPAARIVDARRSLEA